MLKISVWKLPKEMSSKHCLEFAQKATTVSQTHLGANFKIELSVILFWECFYAFQKYLLLQIVRDHAAIFILNFKYCD